MPRRLLVVVTTEVADEAIRELVRSHAGEDAEMLVVAPASKISKLDWLTNDEGDARAAAASAAAGAAGAAPTEDVVAGVGDSDPLQAIEDALRTFSADEILVVTRPDDRATWLEEGAGETAKALVGLPVTHLTVSGSDPFEPAR
jgi:hypothetical protein